MDSELRDELIKSIKMIKDYIDNNIISLEVKNNCLYYKISDEEWTPLLDIGSLRFDNLQTESKTIIGAINELHNKLN